VKRFIVRLSPEERERLNEIIQKGKASARRVLKARILLKADGEGWSDSQIAAALDTSTDTVYRTRQQLVEAGVEAALTRKNSPNSARKRIFDGAAEWWARLNLSGASKASSRGRSPRVPFAPGASRSRVRWPSDCTVRPI